MKIIKLIILSLAILSPSFTNGQSITQIGQNYYTAGIPSEEFEFFSAAQSTGRQRQANWCWAACVQMVLNYHGLHITQEQVVEKIYGGQPENNKLCMHLAAGRQMLMGAFRKFIASLALTVPMK